ncbi:MFS transporter [Actinomyces oris]|uniref:MFS transporter n=1 Tax=Actinomyces oris TaxID=544580 RepID=A0AAW8L9K5_9ACTO|nr:MFS transporter [Actinomyces oris]MDR0177475.1 MFS transporter [Actinomyces oris]
MPSAPNTDDNGTDQPDTDPSSQPGTADSGDEASTAPDTREAEADADRNAAGPSKAATDTGDSEGEPFPPRGTLTLRALRWAGVVGAVAFGVTALVLSRELTEASSVIPDKASTLMWCMFFGGLLVWPFFNFRENKGPILTTIVTTVMAALGMTTSASLTLAWWNTYQETGFSVLFLLVLAGVALAATLFLSAGTLLHYLRMRTTAAGIGDPNDPSRWRRLHFKTGEKTDKGLPRYERIRVPRRTRASLAALVVAPALTLGSAIAGTWALVNPVHHVIATTPADASLAPPTSLAPKASWSKEISSTKLTTVAGAGGPILLTDDGIMAFNPKDGSVLWSYSRKHMTYAPAGWNSSRGELVTSPDGKYVAARVQLPTFVASPQAITLVFDALTGRLVFERQGTGGYLQLTDSAVLDGDTAFSLTDGSQMWSLPESADAPYSGPAGHSSFILRLSEDRSTKDASSNSMMSAVNLTVCPQNDPSSKVEVQHVLSEPPFGSNHTDYLLSVFINGWAARYTDNVDSSGNPVAEAISLDALAKVDGADTTAFPLGATSGINAEASRVSGSMVTYPVISRDANILYPEENSRAATVFDPSTRTVTPASQDRSLAAARTGIVEVPADDGSTSAALVIRPGDGSSGTTIPITPGSTYQPSQRLTDTKNAPAQPLTPRDVSSTSRSKAIRTPGAVIAILNATDKLRTSCGVDSGDNDQTCRSTYRIFGIVGGQK